LYVLDPYGEPVGVGLPGELYIGGVQLARGYWQQEALTREKFIDNPFGEGRLYRTGDLARWQQDGNVEYLGRIDGQVKIRGYRIEPAEIEHAIRSVAGVEQAVVLVHGTGEHNKMLVGFVAGDTRPGVAGLRARLREVLPAYMVPTHFIPLETMPLNQNGKVDQKALLAMAGAMDLGSAVYTPPGNPVEAQLVELFTHLLNREGHKIGVEDNFFELGANSITLTRAAEQINGQFNKSIKTVALFQYPNIRSLVQVHFGQELPAGDLHPEACPEKDLDDVLALFE
ncbi:MAG TPA: non-ribosomal peptide synthetase, partial [Cytophagales bacterium]